ncbi:hypothetical protein AB4Y64_06825 [Lysobacter sp. TAF61]|uniref:hypothetical protein n=1 Tax=Lysobacter sp. TAF61 TaxID=3233072 RepID=UPI003F96C945
MNARNARLTRPALLALALLVPAAAAAQVADDATAPTITIDCQRPLLPSQQAIARLTGVDNPGQAYAVRTRLMIDTQRACQRSPGIVQLVLARPQQSQRLAGR